VEAIRAACIITNLRSTKRFPDKTPMELFSRVKPSIANLKVFGLLVYVYFTQPGRIKLDPRSWACIHLSFDAQVKGYRCYDPGLKRVIISKDVRFLEKSPPLTLHDEIDSIFLADFSGLAIPSVSHAAQPAIIFETPPPPSPIIDLPDPISSLPSDLSLSSSISNPSTNGSNFEQTSPVLDPSSPPVQSPPALRRSTRTRRPPRSH
jgi:hypothetical protein